MSNSLTYTSSFVKSGKTSKIKRVFPQERGKWILFAHEQETGIYYKDEFLGCHLIHLYGSAGSFNFLLKYYFDAGIMPEAIMADFTLQADELAELACALNSFEAFKNVPFLIIGRSGNINLLNKISNTSRIDDIVIPEITDEQLSEKINFFKKVRCLRLEDMILTSTLAKSGFPFQIGSLLKRALDIFISFTLLLLLSPLMVLIAIAIKMESAGPIFYVSPRAGRRYRVFGFYKFRTMVAGAEKQLKAITHLNQYDTKKEKGPIFIKVSNDPRITKVGKFLRNTSLDELPQLINVLKGEMSIVGNRPLPLYEAITLTSDRWVERFLAPAGITGLWQVQKRGKDNMSVDERVALDIMYAHRNNLLYDLRIILHTPAALIQRESV